MKTVFILWLAANPTDFSVENAEYDQTFETPQACLEATFDVQGYGFCTTEFIPSSYAGLSE